jgi:type 1 fimbriae regulatory protein FimB/type 1 fimbriae regulatory protein FimE
MVAHALALASGTRTTTNREQFRNGAGTFTRAHQLQRANHRAADSRLLVHPHMLRHACGFKLANDGQDTRALQHYLGHKSIQHTVRYTELSSERFKNFWE